MIESEQGAQQTHDVPKCLSCGTVTPWQIEPVLRQIDWIIGLVLLCAFGGGLVYLLVVAAVRSNPARRAKLCPKCGARNLWTFVY
jgi:hypothetical protein